MLRMSRTQSQLAQQAEPPRNTRRMNAEAAERIGRIVASHHGRSFAIPGQGVLFNTQYPISVNLRYRLPVRLNPGKESPRVVVMLRNRMFERLNRNRLCRWAAGTCALAFLLSACSSNSSSVLSPVSGIFSPSTGSNGGSAPRVQDCTVVNTGTGDVTKTQYICHGKLYSAKDLYDLRTKDANSK